MGGKTEGTSSVKHLLICRPLFNPTLRLSQTEVAVGFGAVPGLICMRCADLQSFWSPALAQQTPPHIILAGLSGFRGAVLILGFAFVFKFGRLLPALGSNCSLQPTAYGGG